MELKKNAHAKAKIDRSIYDIYYQVRIQQHRKAKIAHYAFK